jgi:hypothetical protein
VGGVFSVVFLGKGRAISLLVVEGCGQLLRWGALVSRSLLVSRRSGRQGPVFAKAPMAHATPRQARPAVVETMAGKLRQGFGG